MVEHSTSNNTVPQEHVIIAPREFCEACHSASGPRFALTELRGPSDIHRVGIIPTGVDKSVAEANIAYAQSEGALLDQEIARVQRSLDSLQKRRDALKLFEAREHSLFAPIRKLPVDILRRIFKLVDSQSPSPEFSDLLSFARIAERVSSSWRSVAHSCAWMWSCIRIEYRYNNKPSSRECPGEYIESCISFSSEMPLDVHIGGGCTSEYLGKSCVQALGRNAYRWKMLSIDDAELLEEVIANIPAEVSIQLLESLSLETGVSINHPTPNLKYLNIANTSDPRNIHISLHSAPSLFSLSLLAAENPTLMFTGNFPWSQITHLDLISVYFNPDEFCTMLESLQGLRSLDMNSETGTTRSIVRPALEELQLSGFSRTNILDILTAPRLKKLEFAWGDFNSDAAVQFGRRSRFALDELELTGMSIHPFVNVPEFSGVKTLVWVNPISAATEIDLLTNGATLSTGDVFPRLEALHIRDISRVDIQSLVDMLKSRLPVQGRLETDSSAQRCCLKDVRIYFDHALDDEDTASLTEFIRSELVQDSGVEVYIGDQGDLKLDSTD